MNTRDVQLFMIKVEPSHMTLGVARLRDGEWAISCSDCGKRWELCESTLTVVREGSGTCR